MTRAWVAAVLRAPSPHRIGAIVMLALPVLLPLALGTSRLQAVAVLGAITALFAYSLNVVFHYGGLLSVAHGGLWGVGAYTMALTVKHWDLALWPALLLAAALGAVVAVLIGIPSFRTAGIYFLVLTFAFGEFLRFLLQEWRSLTGGPNGLVVVAEDPSLLGFTFDSLTRLYFLMLAFAYLGLLCNFLVGRSRLGRRLLAIREDETLARASGVPTFRTKLTAFAISGALAGIAGALFQVHQRGLTPTLFDPFLVLSVVLAIILGGTGSLYGPLIGAFTLTFLPELLGLSPEDSRLAYGALLVVFVLVLPGGILVAGSRLAGLGRRHPPYSPSPEARAVDAGAPRPSMADRGAEIVTGERP